jgi:agmatine deiminase
MTWRMPSETAPQDRVWMAFPPGGYTLGSTAEEAHEARSTWAAVAHAVLEFEPVTMVVDPADVAVAKKYLSAGVDTLEMPLDDAWMRDTGPTFVLDGHGRLGAVDWTFNGWGQQDWARWDNDALLAETIAASAGAELVDSAMVNEGGGIHVDGLGTALVTRTVQLDPCRNPGWDKGDVEAELARTIGATQVIWLPWGLTRDSQKYGTRGHVDIVATIPSAGVVLLHQQTDESHPDYRVTSAVRDLLSRTNDARGSRWEIVDVPAPRTLRDRDGWVDYSYINHLVVNGGVISCGFDDPGDAEARDILAAAYPGREVVSVDARPLFARGGGIHCITQQQPRPFSRAGQEERRSRHA